MTRPPYASLRATVVTVLQKHAADPSVATAQLDDDVDLLQTGVLDSFAFLDFVEGVETETGIPVDLASVGDLPFASIRTFITNLLGVPKE